MKIKNRRSIVLIAAYLVIAILVIWGLAFLSRSIAEQNIAAREKDSLKAFYLAEAGIEDTKKNLYEAFETYFNANGKTVSLFSWFDTLPDVDKYVPPSNTQLGDGTYTVTISDINSFSDGRDLTLVSQGVVNNISRSVTAVVRFGLGQSAVFNYSYFINNYGYFKGGGITSNGDIRANGKFDFEGGPKVNGDVFAEGSISVTGSINNDSFDNYTKNAPSQARPTNPTDKSNPEETAYEAGYDGNVEKFSNQDELEMPYLGDLNTYKSLAATEGGSITQGATTLVNAVYDGNGPDGKSGTPDDGTIVLIGTAAKPIVINGPVVVNNDVIIKGVVKGQGTIYTGRNVHIVGDITYANPPSWPKPDSDPDTTDTTNAAKDILGLAAKGNVVIGNYTQGGWKSTVSPYLSVSAYEVDASDSSIGYVSYYKNGKPYFDGVYTDYDGGKKLTDKTGKYADRKYYESSLADSYINSISSSNITQVNAITYNNHVYAGKVGNFTQNGSIVARDDAVVYSGNINLNYDVRVWGAPETLDIYLPRELAQPQVLSWEE